MPENTSQVLGNLQYRGDQYTKAAIFEKKRLEELEDSLQHINKEIEKFRHRAKTSAIEVMNLHIITPNPAYSRADGVDVERQAKQVTNKVLNMLEMRLNKLLQHKSEVNNKNKLLKLEIDHMRRLRLQTDDSHLKFESSLKQIKESIETILAEANLIVEKRENILKEVERLEKVNKEEQYQFEVEYESMGRFIKDQNEQLENALLRERKQDQSSTNNNLNNSSASTSPTPAVNIDKLLENGIETLQAAGAPKLAQLSIEAEIAIANKVTMLTKFVNSEQISLANTQAKIASYSDMFEQLKKLTNANSLREVAQAYAAQEEEMFSLYNYIQTVNTEIEAVGEDKLSIIDESAKYSKQQEEDEIHRTKVLSELQQRLKTTKDATASCIEQNKIQQDCVDQLSKKVQSIFFKLQCDQLDNKGSQQGGSSKAKGGAGGAGRQENKITMLAGQTISESNILEYMAAIEQRAVDTISEYIMLNQREAMGNKYPTPGPTSPMRTGKVHLEINENALLEETDQDMFGGLASHNDDHEGQTGGQEADSKPVDLDLFKERLRKRKTNQGIIRANSAGNRRRSNYGSADMSKMLHK